MIFVDGQHEEMKIFMKVNSFLNRNMVPQNLFRACVQQVFYLSSCYAHTTPLFVFNKGWNVIFMRSMRFCELTFSNNNTSNNCQATSLTVLPLLLQNTAEIHLVAHYVDDVNTLGLLFSWTDTQADGGKRGDRSWSCYHTPWDHKICY